jgi:hypothetical protein
MPLEGWGFLRFPVWSLCHSWYLVEPPQVDTGMGRLGVLPQNLPPLLKVLKACKHLDVEGIYSHFSRADDDTSYTDKQV